MSRFSIPKFLPVFRIEREPVPPRLFERFQSWLESHGAVGQTNGLVDAERFLAGLVDIDAVVAGDPRLGFDITAAPSITATYDVRTGIRSAPCVTALQTLFRPTLEVPAVEGQGRARVPVAGAFGRVAANVGLGDRLLSLHCDRRVLVCEGVRKAASGDELRRRLAERVSDGHILHFAAAQAYEEVRTAGGSWLLPVVTCCARVERELGVSIETVVVSALDDQASWVSIASPSQRNAPLLPDVREDATNVGFVWPDTKVLQRSAHAVARAEAAAERAGVHVAFSHGGAAALQSHWLRERMTQIEAVDLVYYHGHASDVQWQVHPPDDTSVVSPRLRHLMPAHAAPAYGSRRLRWLVLDACGPFQDCAIGDAASDVFANWADLFGGVRIVMGGAAQHAPPLRVGERFFDLATAQQDGASRMPVAEAWLTANVECLDGLAALGRPFEQGVWSACLIASNEDDDAHDDVLPSVGGARLPPIEPTRITAIWVPSPSRNVP